MPGWLRGFIEHLDLHGVTLMVQDWGGPIGFWVATRQPARFRAFVIGNTWAWPVRGDSARTPPRSHGVPLHVMPREILAARDLLAEVEQGLGKVADRSALVVWGDKDPAFRNAQRPRWERTFPNHRTEILHGASHYIQEDAPDEIITAIQEWWPTTGASG